MFNACCVVSCASKRKDVNMFRFPNRETGLQKWLQCINCDRLRSLRLEELRKCHVCQKHFEKRFISPTPRRPRLRVGAYPTLFSQSEINSGIPRPDPLGHLGNLLEHNYCKKSKHFDHTYCKIEAAKKNIGSDIVTSTMQSESKDVIEEALPSTSQAVTLKGADSHMKTLMPVRKRKLIVSQQLLSPTYSKLYSEYRKSQKQLKYSLRACRALKFSKEKTFEKLTRKMNPFAKKILWMQIKQCSNKAKGRRFSDEEKLIALSIMKQSPRCYRFLQKIFILPSKTTLNKLVLGLNIDTGINIQIFEAIKEEVKTWTENKKYCSLIFDEIALETAITYDRRNDSIIGLVDTLEKKNEFADHALVFLLRGSIHKWLQPLAFYFCKGAASATEIKVIISKMITAISHTGLLPVALVCDQGTAFQSALRSLQEDTRKEQLITGKKIDDFIALNGHKLSVIYDPPHLIKGLRNNFLLKDIKINGKISKWDDIVAVYKTDCNHAQMRLLHKLNDEHVIPEKIKKMKVKNCVRVFSKTVAATLSYSAQFSKFADGTPVSPTLLNTAETVSFFDDLFDSCNGTNISDKNKKPLRQALTGTSDHLKFWNKAIKNLQNIKFVENKTSKEKSVPTLKNWVTTIESYKRLWNFFKSKGIKVMRPRYFNSDPIENFFGQVRAYNSRNINPNCATFKHTFKSLLITRFIKFHTESYNCEEDSGEQLIILKNLFTYNKNNLESSPESSNVGFVNLENVPTTVAQERLHVHSRAYTAGWVVSKILIKINCKQCKMNLIEKDTSSISTIHNYISIREYKSVRERKLAYPSEQAVRCFGDIIREANEYLENQPEKKCILKEIKKHILSKYSFDFLDCNVHRNVVLGYFLDVSLRLTMNNWCNIINKILKGTDIVRLKNKNLPPMQKKAVNRYYKKNKVKK